MKCAFKFSLRICVGTAGVFLANEIFKIPFF